MRDVPTYTPRWNLYHFHGNRAKLIECARGYSRQYKCTDVVRASSQRGQMAHETTGYSPISLGQNCSSWMNREILRILNRFIVFFPTVYQLRYAIQYFDYPSINTTNIKKRHYSQTSDRLCGLVIRVSGYRYRGPGFDSRRYQIFWVVVGLERGSLSLVRSIEELLE